MEQGAELEVRAAEGDSEALTELLELYTPELSRRLQFEIPPRWQAVLTPEDVVQETYIDAFLDIGRFFPRGAGSFFAWLTTLARRNLIDAVRMLDAEKRGRSWQRLLPARRSGESYQTLAELLERSRSTPSRYAARKEAQRCLEQAIAQLPEHYRRVIELYDLEGQSMEAVAEQLGRSPGAVFMLRSRAHRFLRGAMGTASLYLSDSA